MQVVQIRRSGRTILVAYCHGRLSAVASGPYSMARKLPPTYTLAPSAVGPYVIIWSLGTRFMDDAFKPLSCIPSNSHPFMILFVVDHHVFMEESDCCLGLGALLISLQLWIDASTPPLEMQKRFASWFIRLNY